MKTMQVVGAGLISVDNLFLVRRNGAFGKDSEFEGSFPKEELPCRYIGSHGGGSASNTLCVLSKLGFEGSVLGVTGADSGAKLVCDEFQKFGVGTDLIVQKEGATRQFSHLIFSEYHRFSSFCPICRNQLPRSPILREQDVFSSSKIMRRIDESDILHIDRANSMTLKLVDYAYQRGKVISFDFGYHAYWGSYDVACEIIKRTTILKTSGAAAKTMLSRINKSDFRELNPKLLVCIITLGDKGAQITYKSEGQTKSVQLQPYRVSPIVDRAGAGDAFHAGLLYGLREDLYEHNSDVSEPVLRKALNIARGFGSLTCTDYGSRGYFLQKLKEPDFESAILADIGALERGEYHGSPADPDALFARMRSRLLSNDVCGVCGKPFLKNGGTLYERKIDLAPWSMVTSYQTGIQSKKLVSAVAGQRIYLVGSGASLSVAIFGAILLNQLTDMHGIAMTPYEYATLSRPSTSVILISFGGRNPDILAALERAKDGLSPEIHVITGNGQSELAEHASRISTAFVHHVPSVSDAGFVSTQGMLTCASVLLGILTKSFKIDNKELSDFFNLRNLNENFSRIKREVETSFSEVSDALDNLDPLHLIALGSGWAWPAVVDFESKITEGAVCTIEVSELKNYTHGRYLNAYRNKGSRLFVLFELPSDTRLIRFLKAKLSRDFPVLTIASRFEPPIGTLDLLIRGLYASSAISKRLGLDIAKAWRFPKEARGLCSWGPIYSPTSRIDEFVRRKRSQETRAYYQTKLK